VAEGGKLLAVAEKNARILQVGHILRYDTATAWLREAIADGTFGRLQMIRGAFAGFKRPRTDSGILFADGIHFADLYNYLVGCSPRRVTANTLATLGREGMEEAAVLNMEYDLPTGPVLGLIEANCIVPGKSREITIVGSEASATCNFNVSQYKINLLGNRHICEGGIWNAKEGEVHQIESVPEEPLLAELRAFLLSVHTRQTPLADGRSGLEAVRVIEAALRSSAEKRTVELETL